jgi:hypothetical protein
MDWFWPSFTVPTQWRAGKASGLCCASNHYFSRLFCGSFVSVPGVVLPVSLQDEDTQGHHFWSTFISVFVQFALAPDLVGWLCIPWTIKVIDVEKRQISFDNEFRTRFSRFTDWRICILGLFDSEFNLHSFVS